MLIGQRYDDAVAQLERRGLRVDQLSDDTSPQPPGTVIAQNPVAGEPRAQHTTIVLTISAFQAVIPDLKGKAYEAAVASLQRNGFKVDRKEEDAPDKTEGSVLRTDPAAGATEGGDGCLVRLALEIGD